MNKTDMGWGDLLRVLDALPESQWADAASALGFERPKTSKGLPQRPPDETTGEWPGGSDAGAVRGQNKRDPERPESRSVPKQRFWRVASDLRKSGVQTDMPAWLSQAELPGIEAFERAPDAQAPVVAPLVSDARLASFLRRHLARQRRTRAPDMARLLRHLTRREPIHRWPVRERAAWPVRVCVVFDVRERLCPLDEDLRRVLSSLERVLGPRLEVHEADRYPPTLSVDGRCAVAVLGDAGQGAADVALMARWAAWGQRLDRAGARALLLAPLPRRQVVAEVARAMDVALLLDGESASMRLVRRTGWRSMRAPAAGLPDDGVRGLRAALFGHPCVTPDVLRDLRRALARQGAAVDVGTELAVWHDAAIWSGATTCMVDPEDMARVRLDWLALPQAQRTAVVSVMWRHLQAGSPLVRAEYARHIAPEWPIDHPLSAMLRAGIEAADALARQACVAIARSGDRNLSGEVTAYMAQFGIRNLDLVARGGEELQAAWLLAHRDRLRSGAQPLPAGINLDAQAWLLAGDDTRPMVLTLEQLPPAQPGQPGPIQLRLQPRSPETTGIQLASDLPGVAYWSITRHVAQPPEAVQLSLVIDVAVRYVNGDVARAKALVGQLLRDGTVAQGLSKTVVAGLGIALHKVLMGDATTRSGWRQWLAPVGAVLGTSLLDKVPVRKLIDGLLAALPEAVFRQDDAGLLTTSVLSSGEVADAGVGATCRVEVGGRCLELESFERPDWAESIWFDQGEWHAELPDGREVIWTPAEWFDLGAGLADLVPLGLLRKACWWDARDRAQTHAEADLSWASATGSDELGSWAEFTVRGRRGSVTQRLRWIPPGEFLMGSPESEKERSTNGADTETQHPVLLTQGYWLADTACTQELWEAVMRKNPSDFKNDPQNPVENVSWNDITQEFLPHLNKLVPGLNLTLPTEAQWEYACRAGTQTRYSFGDEIDQDQVNFEGKRGKTVPVKALPENRWGLYQMHGNVWEWCQDALAAYPEGTLIDPVVHQDKKEKGRLRVLRGGGWILNGRYCRSASRNASGPDGRSSSIGFRLARGLADQPDQLRQFGQPEAGGAEPPGISRSPEGEAQPPKAARNLKQKARRK
ncbi:formylglycine-generating enzyme family protein [Sphaerotilus sp.]|uniref:formylglycine-generating enzyme family protein n=1 Tax=Sphaerotilus sp. TaxID=2093942 RepID=UPI00286DADA2|nr:formylglycine-generating enzyme family protein [Sphaerotilus sp.]